MARQEEPPAGTSKKFELLPTGKPHVSFSEERDWDSCSYRHKLKHILKIDLGKPGPLLDFGTAVHAACEDYLRTRSMKPTIALDMIEESWKKNADIVGFEPAGLDAYLQEARGVLVEVPEWMEKTFPGWQFIDAEHYLYEPIDGHPHAFKGFIDGIITCAGPRGKTLVWLLDWKTTSWGWSSDKKSDPDVRSQLTLYKHFWSSKTKTDPRDVRCGFVLLKRTAKEGSRCELVTSSVGDVTTKRSLTVLNNMVTSIKRGIALKNRNNCTYCEYRETEHCT